MNIFGKLYYKIQISYIVYFDSINLLNYYKNILYTQYIFRIPQYVILFINKYYLMDKINFCIFYFIFLIMTLFLLNNLIKMIQFLNINSNSLYREIMIINHKTYNWFFVYYKFIFIIINLLNIFIICFFKDFPKFCFILVCFLIFIETMSILYFSKKRFFYFNFFNILTTGIFFIWIIFVCMKKFFYLYFPFVLSTFYVFSNLLKLISKILLIYTLKDLKKKQANNF